MSQNVLSDVLFAKNFEITKTYFLIVIDADNLNSKNQPNIYQFLNKKVFNKYVTIIVKNHFFSKVRIIHVYLI